MEGFKKNDRWTDEEVQALLSIYGDEETQRHFESATRNDKVYQLITAELAELSIFHTQKQVREKFKKLKQDYKKFKDHNNRSGNDRKINKWYERLDVILGHRMGCTTGKTKDSAIAMLEAMCEDTAVGEDSSPTDTLTHQAGPSLSSLPSDVSLSSPVSVEALEGISEDGPSTSGNCAPLSTSTSNDEVNIRGLRAESAELFLSLLPCSPVQDTFEYLCYRLGPELEKSDTNYRLLCSTAKESCCSSVETCHQ
ncbi:uncharacterized protein LOC144020947 [Festucalex cinctus]